MKSNMSFAHRCRHDDDNTQEIKGAVQEQQSSSEFIIYWAKFYLGNTGVAKVGNILKHKERK